MRLRSFILTMSVLLAISPSRPLVAQTSTVTPDDLSVLRVVLSAACLDAHPHSSVVSDVPPVPGDYPIPSDWPSHGLDQELAARARRGARWPPVEVCAAVRIADGRMLEALFARDGRVPPSWDGFHAQFPGARSLLAISVPAYSADRKLALVYMAVTCGVQCGAGFYRELRREASGWRITRRATAWIS